MLKTLKLKLPEPTEGELQAALIRRLQAAGYLVLRVNGGGFTDKTGRFVRTYTIAGLDACSGFPDVVAFRADRPARLFEMKKRGGQCSPAQTRFATFAGAHEIRVEIVEGAQGLNDLEL